MKACPVDKVRNFVLAGHAGAGKTSLADLLLHKSGVVSRIGSVDQGTSLSDFRPEEQQRKSSIFSAALHCPWNDHHLFFIDTPGYADFVGEAVAAIRVADIVVIVVDAAAGIGPGTINAWRYARDHDIPRLFFVTGMDRDHADFEGVVSALQGNYGATVVTPFTVPVGQKADFSGVAQVLQPGGVPDALSDTIEKYREALMDTVAESDEELMMRYLDGEELSQEEIARGLHESIRTGAIVPVFAGSVAKDIGVDELMDGIVNLFPSPVDGLPVPLIEGELVRAVDGAAHGLVFKSVTDPFIGQMAFFRVYSGTFKSDSEIHNVSTGNRERVGTLLYVNGKEQEPVDEAGPGEIVAAPKLRDTTLGDTLSSSSGASQFPPYQFPQPNMAQAVYAATKGDEDKVSSGLQRLTAEDPTLLLERNQETHQTVLRGMGDQQIATVVSRLQTEFKVDVRLGVPKVPYRETITASGSAQYRHKKQTGGHGQFAEVHLRLEPLVEEEFEFGNEIKGGNIPSNYVPAVQKGVVEAMVEGPLAGCKVINMRAVVYDGKHHAVDSSEMAFKIAARGAFRDAMKNAQAILLEPIMKMKIVFPEEYMGDVSGDLNSRRGRILGMDHEEGFQVVHAEAPMGETFTYATQLRSMTQGRGSFEMTFDRYEPVPPNVSQQIQADAARAREEEE